MPPFVRVLSGIFLGIPGILMWLWGIIVTGTMSVLGVTLQSDQVPQFMLLLTAGIAATALGFVMITACGLFIDGNRHQLAAGHIAGMAGLAIAAQLLAVISLCLLFPAVTQLILHNTLTGLEALAACAAACAGSFHLHRLGFRLRVKWQREQAASFQPRAG